MTDTSKYAVDRLVLAMIRSGNTTAANMLTALAVERDAANTRADQARDSALEDVAKEAHAFAAENQWHPSSVTNLVTRIIALRDKPATAVTVHEAARVLLTYLSETQDSVVWETTEDAMAVPMADPGDVIFSALRAIAGGGDE